MPISTSAGRTSGSSVTGAAYRPPTPTGGGVVDPLAGNRQKVGFSARPSTSSAPAIDFGSVFSDILGGGSGGSQQKSSGPLSEKGGKYYDSSGSEWVLQNNKWVPKSSGGGGGGGKAGGGGGGGLFQTVNKAEEDPRLGYLANKVQNRLENPQDSTRRSIDSVGLALRDLQSGQERELDANLAQRGVSGSGMGGAARQQMSADTAGRIGGAARDITIQRARDEDAFLLGSQGALGAPGEANRADRQLAGSLWIENEQNRRQQESADLQRQLAVLNLLSNFAGV